MLIPLRGKTPQVSPEAFIAETAALIGDVTVGADSSVWFGAVVRGDNEPITVGSGTSIQDNAVLHTEKGHPLTIGDNVTVGHGAIVDILWLAFLGSLGIYEILPGCIIGLIVGVLVTLATPAPEKAVTDLFDKAKAGQE